MGADDQPPGLRADGFPARLHAPARVHLVILSLFKWDTYYLFWTVDDGPQNIVRILDHASNAGTVDHDFIPPSAGLYSFQAQGCPVDALGPAPPASGKCSPASEIVRVQVVRQNSTRAFFVANGIAPSKRGVRLQGARSLRELLSGQ
jgi:hypothetical protein